MNLLFAPQAWEDYLHWQATNPKIVVRINELVKDTRREPYRGIGKPEPLRYQWQGYWSRRINQMDRMIYRVEGGTLFLAQLRSHY